MVPSFLLATLTWPWTTARCQYHEGWLNISVCACVNDWGKHPLGLLLCSFILPFLPLCLSFSLTSISPSQPGAPSNHPMLWWLDFSLVNSPRLSMTSSGSLPTDYTLSFFSTSSLVIPWTWDGTTCPIGTKYQSYPTGWAGHHTGVLSKYYTFLLLSIKVVFDQ